MKEDDVNDADQILFQYWGKASVNASGNRWHPLVYHAIDVATVASCWWTESSTLKKIFSGATNKEEAELHQLCAWVLFFVALHDLGKLDLRFQLKAPQLFKTIRPEVNPKDYDISNGEITNFNHGLAGLAWANHEYRKWIDDDDNSREIWERWSPWLIAVTGHHGEFLEPTRPSLLEADKKLIAVDVAVRHAFLCQLEQLFLKSAGQSLKNGPPNLPKYAQFWLAGFCSVCDWIGSNEKVFPYHDPGPTLEEYYELSNVNSSWMSELGLSVEKNEYRGVGELLPDGKTPRGCQVLVDSLPLVPGMTLIEAPTGSGKTEAALAYAWRLLAAETADSIIFALPTQATTNAMFLRVVTYAERIFDSANLVLAHGKSHFIAEFQALIASAKPSSAQGSEEASIQCAEWLATSRKRVFLGQMGICTVDQVLLSVLPVRHNFVRGFGVYKSILIVDEVHAYDAYMHGLLGEVLKRQSDMGGSAVLLSATLPEVVRRKLFESWGAQSNDAETPYPAVWHITPKVVTCTTVPEDERPQTRFVGIQLLKRPKASPDDQLLEQIVTAAESGALVGVVVNLVDEAQRLARDLNKIAKGPVDIFHARYRFIDRLAKEKTTLEHYGRSSKRNTGRILVATQVVEQSVDLDFDWMITQICPVDILFQRMGRLHRHDRKRPRGFEKPRCQIISVGSSDYGLHKLIYGNARVLWRTEKLLSQVNEVVFPNAYRTWIEEVYAEESWNDEPDEIYGDYCSWRQEQQQRESEAIRLTTMNVTDFRDTDARVTSLTRDGETSLTVLLLREDGALLDGTRIKTVNERDQEEVLTLHSVPVPASWRSALEGYERDVTSRFLLEMKQSGEKEWATKDNSWKYSETFGLERTVSGPA